MQTRKTKRGLRGALAAAAVLAAAAAQAVGVPGQGTWETTLLPRDLDGNAVNGPEAFYDTALDITWLRNADVNGAMNWTAANTWANALMVNGISGWRLPTMVDTAAPGCDAAYSGTDCGYNVQTASSEMAHLWYVALGNKGYRDTSGNPNQPGWGLTNTGNFQNLLFAVYWAGLGYATNPAYAWYFDTTSGEQSARPIYLGYQAMAVHPGDVTAVPEPQTHGLMLMGVAALLLAVKRRPH